MIEDQSELVSLAREDGTLVYVTPAYARHFGRPVTEMIGHNPHDFIEESERDAVRLQVAGAPAARSTATRASRRTSPSTATRRAAPARLEIAAKRPKTFQASTSKRPTAHTMIPAPIPDDDQRRLKALREMLILDTSSARCA